MQPSPRSHAHFSPPVSPPPCSSPVRRQMVSWSFYSSSCPAVIRSFALSHARVSDVSGIASLLQGLGMLGITFPAPLIVLSTLVGTQRAPTEGASTYRTFACMQHAREMVVPPALRASPSNIPDRKVARDPPANRLHEKPPAVGTDDIHISSELLLSNYQRRDNVGRTHETAGRAQVQKHGRLCSVQQCRL